MSECVVIGGGHNGLVAAAVLAGAGHHVRVLESRGVVGGLAAGREFHPGYSHTGILHDTRGVRRELLQELGLAAHGLARCDDVTPVFAAEREGRGLIVQGPPDIMSSELSDRGFGDSEAHDRWQAFLGRVGPFVRKLTGRDPLPLSAGSESFWQLVRTGIDFRRLGRDDMLEMMRILPMCIADWLNEWFQDELLKSALAYPGLEATWTGPWSAGGVTNLLLDESVAEKELVGGPAALVRALEDRCRAKGVEILTGHEVKRIVVAKGVVKAVELADGGQIDVDHVVSTCDPKRTLLDLVDPRELPVRLVKPIQNFRTRGTTAKVHLAIEGPLEFPGRPEVLFEHARTGECLDDVEKAFDAVKYGRFSREPYLDIRVPTVSDPGLAPADHHVVSILVHYVPHDLRSSWNDEARETLGKTVVDRLGQYVPGIHSRIVGGEVLTPADLSEEYGLTGGHLHHGERAIDQLLSMRPCLDCGSMGTPIEGLFLGGSGAHPGGGINGMAGLLAARAVVRA